MAEAIQIREAAIPGQPDRVALFLGDVAVAHVVSEEAARLFVRGWAARLALRRRLAPRSMLGEDRRQWLRGWDKANAHERRAVAA